MKPRPSHKRLSQIFSPHFPADNEGCRLHDIGVTTTLAFTFTIGSFQLAFTFLLGRLWITQMCDLTWKVSLSTSRPSCDANIH